MFQNTVYFITTDYLKKYYSGYLDANIDDDALNSFILIAQNVRIQSVLGYNLYTKFINDIQTYGAPQGAAYLFLMNNYIQPAVALYAIYEAAPSLGFKITNKAVSQKSSEYETPSSRQDIEYIRNQILNNAQFYSQRIREAITNDPTSYPEYYQVTGVNRVRAKNNNYFAGLFLPDSLWIRNRNGFQRDERCCGQGDGYYVNI
jgi:hypothetical protein